ncbi:MULTISPECIES: TetR/AcrR family transcriptional regulator [unclassified Coleofasciculus]|uniref:TetR/AcrR family transcriptional regulator n=2 Tax=Cyanobacteriota TaxID=1117 RepID=UPI0016835780|nr:MULTISPECIES: TetR/AcrR family transcriptional regulator [unclassified Coleofasciculus]MBD1833446.1 TetR/AcrR family transcriptional regulator [Cyanobacteria bacterium FACHB-472]MBD1880694.1 TetR/AcrR family transcriptional regulator [Coleofasciculus sp. FACHB-T130]MBD1893819.1 TetR/AcrR family transcriptional regulator [Coleofasciculus sp. FACHB-129]MBD1900895.1 TetR/AcrR family transcriptional regulator [Coleofasciculus sp. FACHB-125]
MRRTKMTEPKQDGLAEKAEQILTGAMQEFLVHGYAATSMDRVAKTAGVSKPTVYTYFQDKEGLFTALVQRFAQRKFSIIQRFLPSEGDAFVVLRQLLTKALNEIICDGEEIALLRLIIGESGRFPELAQIFVRTLVKPGVETLSQYLASSPNLKIADPEATARIFLGALVHFMMVQKMLHGQDILPMESDRLIDSLMNLLKESEA